MIANRGLRSLPAIYKSNSKDKNNLAILLTLIGVGLSIYIAHINTVNLEYNKRSAFAGEKIAEQLKLINHSNFMYRLNNHIDKEG